jgi:hypothetical protein
MAYTDVALELLRSAEWSHPMYGEGFCPVCEQHRDHGHRACPLGLGLELTLNRRRERPGDRRETPRGAIRTEHLLSR